MATMTSESNTSNEAVTLPGARLSSFARFSGLGVASVLLRRHHRPPIRGDRDDHGRLLRGGNRRADVDEIV
jgi:hypothetical protein